MQDTRAKTSLKKKSFEVTFKAFIVMLQALL